MSEKLLRIKEVSEKTGLGRSTIYAKLDPKDKRYDPHFPKSVQISLRAVAWSESEINQWVNHRISASSEYSS